MQFSIISPDDMHLHLRDGDMLKTTVPASAKIFERAIVMPNLKKPLDNIQDILDYKKRIIKQIPTKYNFTPLMTVYLTSAITKAQMIKMANDDNIYAAKLYPSGVTTNSSQGIKQIKDLYPLFEVMQENLFPLLIHGEVVDKNIDIFAKEKVFIDTELVQIVKRFPSLPIVLEHISTKYATDFIKEALSNVVATITPHHLICNRNDLLSAGIKPHLYCLPILKQEIDREALVRAAISKNPKFFAGTDSAPHLKIDKESSCGCAGCFTAPYALELYADVFAKNNALDNLEFFTSIAGANFYRLPINKNKVTLKRNDYNIPPFYKNSTGKIIPFMAGEKLNFKVSDLN
jgi:dihydroorotase